MSSLSRISRDSVLLATVVEFVLAHQGTRLTMNCLLRPGEAFVRRPPLIGPASHDPLSVVTEERLSGVHTPAMARCARRGVELSRGARDRHA